jgi:hypothetical protein
MSWPQPASILPPFPSPPTRSAAACSPGAPSAAAAPEEPPPAALTWGDACQWALGRPAPLWPLLFEAPLVGRARQLVARDFAAAAEEVEQLLGAALQASSCRCVCVGGGGRFQGVTVAAVALVAWRVGLEMLFAGAPGDRCRGCHGRHGRTARR